MGFLDDIGGGIASANSFVGDLLGSHASAVLDIDRKITAGVPQVFDRFVGIGDRLLKGGENLLDFFVEWLPLILIFGGVLIAYYVIKN